MAELEISRVEWMGDTGKQIYGEWADTLLDACDAEYVQANYRSDGCMLICVSKTPAA